MKGMFVFTVLNAKCYLPAVGSTIGCLLKCITPHWYIPTRIWSTGNARSAKRIGPDNAAPENTGPHVKDQTVQV